MFGVHAQVSLELLRPRVFHEIVEDVRIALCVCVTRLACIYCASFVRHSLTPTNTTCQANVCCDIDPGCALLSGRPTPSRFGPALVVDGRNTDECRIVLAREAGGETDRDRSMADDTTRKLCHPNVGFTLRSTRLSLFRGPSKGQMQLFVIPVNRLSGVRLVQPH